MLYISRTGAVAAALCLAAVMACAITSCAGTGSRPKGADERLATAVKVDTISLVPLDDPSNPFCGQYKAWDVWVYENLEMRQPEKLLKHPDEMTRAELEAYITGSDKPAKWTERKARVYDGKYLVPYLVSLADFERARADHTVQALDARSRFVTAAGVMEPALRDEMQRQGDKVTAALYPPIPAWLVVDPPRAAMLLPNGDVITERLVSEGAADADGGPCGGAGSTVYSRYDAAGNLIAARQDGWWGLYHDADRLGMPEGEAVMTTDGYFKFYDVETGQLLSVWDYDGTRLASEDETAPRDPHYFTMAAGTVLASLYEAAAGSS